MPIYEYQCTSCHHHFDLMQKINDAPIKECPNCFENQVIRLISAAGFQLKGTGWYATDFKNKGKPEPKSESVASESTSTAEKTNSTSSSSDKASSKSTQGESD